MTPSAASSLTPARAPRGCPAGPARWSARRGRAARAAAAARRRCRAAAACPASTPGSACRPRRSARPGPARRPDPGPAVAGSAVRSAASSRARFARPDRYGWNAGPSTSAPTRGSTSRRGRAASAGRAACALPAVGRDQAEQHPDRGGLARPVRPEEAVHAAVRDRQVDAVDGDLAAAEPLGQPAGRDRRTRPPPPPRRAAAAGASTAVIGPRPRTAAPAGTAPAISRPSSVSSTDTSVEVSSRPLPQLAADPLQLVEDRAGRAAALGRCPGRSRRRTTTVVQPEPTVRTASPARSSVSRRTGRWWTARRGALGHRRPRRRVNPNCRRRGTSKLTG